MILLKVLLAKWSEESLPTRLLSTIFIEVTEEGDLVGRCLKLPDAIKQWQNPTRIKK